MVFNSLPKNLMQLFRVFRSMNIFFVGCILVSSILPQEKTVPQSANASEEKAPTRKSHVTGGIISKRFSVSNLSFLRRYEPQGKGEILEVIFDVKNKTIEKLYLKFFIVGFNEKNGVDLEYRKRVPYPTWRKLDFEKDVYRISFLDSIPKIEPSEVIRTEIKKTIQGTELNKKYAGFLAYVKHIEKNSNSGVPFTLYALENVPSPIVREASNSRITELRAQTNIEGSLYIRYGLDQSYNFINHIGIIIYDANTDEIAYRQFYQFKKSPNFR